MFWQRVELFLFTKWTHRKKDCRQNVANRDTMSYFTWWGSNTTEVGRTGADPPENCQVNVKKLPKTWYFFQKIAKNLTFFSKKLPKIFIFFKKIANGNFFEKNENFWQFFWKKKVKFLAIFWQSNGNFQEGQPHTFYIIVMLKRI